MLRELDSDTIAAISTPMGEGGIGVIRLSGKDSIAIADKLFRPRGGKSIHVQKSHTAQLGTIVAKADTLGRETVIDEVLVLLMKGPNSFTREDVVEISAHGGPAVLQAILQRTLEEGARAAARGEFTKRAFLSGRLDLVQAEAVLDLIQAKTPLAREWAAQQLEGALSKKFLDLKDRLVEVLTHVEAQIDFPEDSPDTDTQKTLLNKVTSVARSLEELVKSSDAGLLVKRGLAAVIAGRPNVGKSSLMNALTKTNRVIVTPFSGTTRDVVDQEIQIAGIPVRLSDTAGIAETEHPIEKEGIERSKLAVQDADLVLYVLDNSQPWHKEDESLLQGLGTKPIIIVLNKSDLKKCLDKKKIAASYPEALLIETSCVQEIGVIELEEMIVRSVAGGRVTPSAEVLVNSARQKNHLENALTHARTAMAGLAENRSPELLAIDLRSSLDELGALVGEVVTDDILERLFQRFCIGK